jgi:flagellar motility protein MotE (MotC chaperone)
MHTRPLIALVFLATAAVFAESRSGQSAPQTAHPPGATPLPQKQEVPPAPVGKLTPLQRQSTTTQKSLPCSQRLKAQVSLNDELTDRANALEKENASLHNLNNDLVTKWQEAAKETAQMLTERDETIGKQRKLLDQYSTMSKALAAEMISSDVSGNWTIQTGRGQLVCNVQVYQDSRTIQLTNCQ